MSELLEALEQSGIVVTEAQIRWAIKKGRVRRPRLDGSLRFCFGEEDLMAFRDLFDPDEPQGRPDDGTLPPAQEAKEVRDQQ